MTDKERSEILERALRDVNQVLIVPAAEYVPAIPDAWNVIDRALRCAGLAPVKTR